MPVLITGKALKTELRRLLAQPAQKSVNR